MTSGEGEGDFSLSLSSDVIAEVMEKHFNKEMFKRKVTIVDLKPLPDGYMFLLAYVDVKQERIEKGWEEWKAEHPINGVAERVEYTEPVRAKNGRFVKKDA